MCKRDQQSVYLKLERSLMMNVRYHPVCRGNQDAKKQRDLSKISQL